ncbi:hypothetical protein B9G55_08325 [Saccharibacillus sp. O16]|nr:hypothetical protein B9G55_08325 [Saccharibacillus sp. O16]
MGSMRRVRGHIGVSIILLYLFVSLVPDQTAARWAGLVLYILYVGGLAVVTGSLWSRLSAPILLGLYGVTLAYGLTFDASISLLFTLQGFLTAYTALRVPGRKSAILAAFMLLVTFLAVVLLEGYSWMTLLRQELFIYVGLYAVLRMIRLRRVQEAEEQKHNEELKIVHAQLADTHASLQRAHEELERATVQSLRYAVLEERSRIARDIHDSIGHRLTSVIVQLQALPYVLKSDPAESEQIVRTVLDVARSCLQEVRVVVHNMEADGSGAGLISLRSLVQQTASASGSPAIALEMEEEAGREEWPPGAAAALYRCLQEALTNTIRHAEAQHVEVRVTQNAEQVMLNYRDDGKLSPDEPLREGFGLGGIRKRCRDAGGSCVIAARQPHGIAIDIVLPLTGSKEETQA